MLYRMLIEYEFSIDKSCIKIYFLICDEYLKSNDRQTLENQNYNQRIQIFRTKSIIKAITRTTIFFYFSRTCYLMLKKCQSCSERNRILNTKLRNLTTSLNIQLKKIATTFSLLKIEIEIIILTTTTTSISKVTTRFLSSTIKNNTLSILYQL